MKQTNVRGLVYAGLIACLYAVLTVMPGLSAISYGNIQFRISEVLTILPIFNVWAIPGLAIGCALSNLASPMIALDLPFGTLATFLAAMATYRLRNKPILALSMPAVFNGLIIGSVITFFNFETNFAVPLLFINMGTVAFGELIVCYVLGLPLAKILKKIRK